jgi:hypothetical protein
MTGLAIDVVDTGHDALLELLLRPNPDVAQDRAGELGEEVLDEVEPGAVLGCEGELETAGRPSGQPSSGLPSEERVRDQAGAISGEAGGEHCPSFFSGWSCCSYAGRWAGVS